MIGALLTVVAIQATAIVALLMHLTRRRRVERSLRESEERFRLVADRAPVMIWTARPDTTLDYLNSTCAEFTGRRLEQLSDEGWLDVVHPEDLDRCLQTYGPAFEARKPFLMEYRVRHADGEYRWLLASGVPKFGADGSFAGYIGCDVDITERRNAEDRIRESRAALEQSRREIQHLAGRLIEAQDAERARVARDLHDDVPAARRDVNRLQRTPPAKYRQRLIWGSAPRWHRRSDNTIRLSSSLSAPTAPRLRRHSIVIKRSGCR